MVIAIVSTQSPLLFVASGDKSEYVSYFSILNTQALNFVGRICLIHQPAYDSYRVDIKRQ